MKLPPGHYYYFDLQDKFNLIAFPKCGCTQIIKICTEINNTFKSHNHSYKHNKCDKHLTIHACGRAHSNLNEKNLSYIALRPPVERVLSFYLANYHDVINNAADSELKNLSFKEFVDLFTENKITHDDHLVPYVETINRLKGINFKLIKLECFNKFIQEMSIKHRFGLHDIEKKSVINNTALQSLRGDKAIDEYFNIKYSDLSKYRLVNRQLFFNDRITQKINDFFEGDVKLLDRISET